MLARPSTLSLLRVRELFDAIDKSGGIARRWWLERNLTFAANTTALDRWLTVFLTKGYLKQITIKDGSNDVVAYQKTELGEVFHRTVKDYEHVKILNDVIQHFSKDRLTR